MKHWFAYCLMLLPFCGWNQLTLNVNVNVADQPVRLSLPVSLSNQQVQLDQVRFYLSGFAFYRGEVLISKNNTEAYLIDLENDSTRILLFPGVDPNQVDRVTFLFGIDSVTNTSGAMGGALDPMHGMYWSWQSGYINCKVEGSILSTKPREFQFHLGGYAEPYSSAQSVSLSTTQNQSLNLNIDLAPLLTTILSSEDTHVMSPCTKAVEYAKLLAETIALKP